MTHINKTLAKYDYKSIVSKTKVSSILKSANISEWTEHLSALYGEICNFWFHQPSGNYVALTDSGTYVYCDVLKSRVVTAKKLKAVETFLA